MSRRFRGKRGLMSVTANFGDRSSVTVKPLRDAPGKYASNHYPTGIAMELTKKERLSFIYQLRILEALYPDDADYYAKNRKALGTPRGGI